MRRLATLLVGGFSIAFAVVLVLIKRGVFLIGATTVVEDAEGIPGKARAVTEFIQHQPEVWFYGALALILALGIALLIPPDRWKGWFSTLTFGRALAPTAQDHKITSYGQSGGITAHTVHSNDGGSDVRERQEP